MAPFPHERDGDGYRLGVGMMVLNSSSKVFIGHRRLGRHEGGGAPSSLFFPPEFAWQMPQGGVERGEDTYLAALRELQEETGMTSVSLLAQTPDWISYDLPLELQKSAFQGRFKGQKQKWYAFRFEGLESEIDLFSCGKSQAEFDAWRWEYVHNLPHIVVPFKRSLYETVLAHFSPLVA